MFETTVSLDFSSRAIRNLQLTTTRAHAADIIVRDNETDGKKQRGH
jgi:hypothetical protein